MWCFCRSWNSIEDLDGEVVGRWCGWEMEGWVASVEVGNDFGFLKSVSLVSELVLLLEDPD